METVAVLCYKEQHPLTANDHHTLTRVIKIHTFINRLASHTAQTPLRANDVQATNNNHCLLHGYIRNAIPRQKKTEGCQYIYKERRSNKYNIETMS
jgi:hypothetical protein